MTDIKVVKPNDKNFEVASSTDNTKPLVNYKKLAYMIAYGRAGEIFELEVRDRGLYSNIKRALLKRKLHFGEHYDMAYRTVEGKKFIFITVKG